MVEKIAMHRVYSILILLGIFFMAPVTSRAQELQFNVTIDASQVPDVQKAIIDDMQMAIKNFLNNRNWTEDQFAPEERIKCNIVISIVTIPAQYSYIATAQVQCSRPVYGTTYETVLFNYFDKSFIFELNQGQQLIYNENVFNSNLGSMLSFYAYVILAMDYDSFGKLGGSKYIDKAMTLAGVARDQAVGWIATSDPNNRGSLLANLNNQQFVPYREAWYNYHRKGLDNFIKDPAGTRQVCFDMIKTIQSINKVNPYSILLRSFFLAKRDELINIFKDAEPAMKNDVITLFRELDPANSQKYETILKK
ncbi:MAG: hypothetical protein JWM14_1880 [Chitinophagaceae bacterium]|nr:hypothetical protein [Chitinophagaceae bacterium]